MNGLGGAVCEVLSEEYPVKVTRMGIRDEFGMSGKWDELMEHYEIDAKAVVKKVKELVK